MRDVQPAKAERHLSFPALILALRAGQEHLEGWALLRKPWWQRCPSTSPCQSSASHPILERGNQFTLALGTGKMLSVKDYTARKASLKGQTPISSPMSQLKHQMETIQKVILSCFSGSKHTFAAVRFIRPTRLRAGFGLCHAGKSPA